MSWRLRAIRCVWARGVWSRTERQRTSEGVVSFQWLWVCERVGRVRRGAGVCRCLLLPSHKHPGTALTDARTRRRKGLLTRCSHLRRFAHLGWGLGSPQLCASCARPSRGGGSPPPPLTGSLSGVRQARTAHERWSQAREPAESGVMTPRQGSARRLGRWAGSCMSGELRHGGGGGAGACHTREANPPPDRGPLGREVRRTVAELR
jgi:hypothetical protein